MPPKITFLLGRAGTGKTARCLAEAKVELEKASEGKPLLFLAPKQATYQIERGLLSSGIEGFSRLYIFSFERLAYWIFSQAGKTPPSLNAFGRQLIVQSLLVQLHKELKVYKSAASHAGFIEEICGFIEEACRKKISAGDMKAAASNAGGRLQAKLLDLAIILDCYEKRLSENNLVDPARLLDKTAALWESSSLEFEHIWLDGFADLTPQELFLLKCLAGRAKKVTLAFCTPADHKPDAKISEWNPVWNTVVKARNALHTVGSVSEESLEVQHRFAGSPALQHVEAHWDRFISPAGDATQGLNLLECENPEAEAIAAAHAILDHVRKGGRYREIAVLPRNLQDYSVVFRRVFLRYEIPFFLDSREPVINHPLVRLTKSAMRLVLGEWERGNWLSVLKTGLLRISPQMVDNLENHFMETGLDGEDLFNPKYYGPDKQYKRTVAPLLEFQKRFHGELTGTELAGHIRGLWKNLKVPATLAWMCRRKPETEPLHTGVWKQLEQWLDQLEAAFSNQTLSCRDWAALTEAALNTLTIGLIPPSLDQVLIGSIERSRNPDLKVAIIPGCNDGVFPQLPSKSRLFSSLETLELQTLSLDLARGPSESISRERFLGYIAFTRARESVLATYAKKGFGGETLEPSCFVQKLRQLLPQCSSNEFIAPSKWEDCKHSCEAEVIALQDKVVTPETSRRIVLLEELNAPALTADLAQSLFGNPFRTSISQLEKFAKCNYQFFLSAGLKLREREENLLGVMERGDFQHGLLAGFHNELQKQKLTWRTISREQANQLLKLVANEQKKIFRHGSLTRSEQNEFLADAMIRQVQRLIDAMLIWMSTYSFEPSSAEITFGEDESELPGVEITNETGATMLIRGKIDRLDLIKDGNQQFAVVIDYKSSGKKFDSKEWHNGLQIQLPVYLLAIQEKKYLPAGMFYVQIKDKRDRVKNRSEECKDSAYKHIGRFQAELIRHFDPEPNGEPVGQFPFKRKKDLAFDARTKGPLAQEDFAELLSLTRTALQRTAEKIFSGEIAVNPFKKSCEYCNYTSVCRIDKWTHEFRELEEPDKKY